MSGKDKGKKSEPTTNFTVDLKVKVCEPQEIEEQNASQYDEGDEYEGDEGDEYEEDEGDEEEYKFNNKWLETLSLKLSQFEIKAALIEYAKTNFEVTVNENMIKNLDLLRSFLLKEAESADKQKKKIVSKLTWFDETITSFLKKTSLTKIQAKDFKQKVLEGIKFYDLVRQIEISSTSNVLFTSVYKSGFDQKFAEPDSKSKANEPEKDPVSLASNSVSRKKGSENFFEFIKKVTQENRGPQNATIEAKKITVHPLGTDDLHTYTVTPAPESNSDSAIYIPHKVGSETIPTNDVLASMCEDALKAAENGQIFTISQGTPEEQQALNKQLRQAIQLHQKKSGNESLIFIIKLNGNEEKISLDPKKQTAQAAQAAQEVEQLDENAQYKAEITTWIQSLPEGYNWIPEADKSEDEKKIIFQMLRQQNKKISINGLPVSSLLHISVIGNNCLPNVMLHAAIFKEGYEMPESILKRFQEFYGGDVRNSYDNLTIADLKRLYDGLAPEDQEKIFGPVIRLDIAMRLGRLGEPHRSNFMSAFENQTKELHAKSNIDPQHPWFTLKTLYEKVVKAQNQPITEELKDDFIEEYYKCFSDYKNPMTTTDLDLKAYANCLGFKVKIYTPQFVFQNPTADDLCEVVNVLPDNLSNMKVNTVYLDANGNGDYVLKLIPGGPIITGNIGSLYFENSNQEARTFIERVNALHNKAVTEENKSEWKKVVVKIAAIKHGLYYHEADEFRAKPIDTIILYNESGNHWECVGEKPSPAIQQKLQALDAQASEGTWGYNNLEPLREVINQVLKAEKGLEQKTQPKI